MDFKALKSAIQTNIKDEKREKDEIKQRAASERARSRRVESETVRQQETEELKEKLQTLPDGNKVGFKLDDIGIFRSVFNVCEGLNLDEIPFEFSADGMSVQVMDPSHVSMLVVSVPANTFYNYVYEGPKTTRVGFRTSDLKAASKIFASARSLTWIIQGEKATIDMGNNHNLKLDLVETYGSSPQLPKIELAAKVTMSKYALAKVLRESALAEENQFRITVDPKKQEITFEGKGNLGDSKVILPRNGEVYDVLADEEQHATYTVGYLHPVVKSAIADSVIMQLGTGKPLRLDFPLSDVREGAVLTFWLAPWADPDTARPKPGSPPVTPQPAPEPDEGPRPATSDQGQPSPTASSAEQPPATKKSKPRKKSK